MAVVETSADHAAPRTEEAPSDSGERKMRDLEELLSKLNPIAEEFILPCLASPVAAAGPVADVRAPLSPTSYGYYAANGGFAVASPFHRGVVGFPAAGDGPAGRFRIRRTLPSISGRTSLDGDPNKDRGDGDPRLIVLVVLGAGDQAPDSILTSATQAAVAQTASIDPAVPIPQPHP